MEGILTKNENGIWMVKWSDLHSFGHGTHWMFTELSDESNSIKYIKDDKIMFKPLEEGLEVEFEMVITGADNFNSSAKLKFPEVDEFEKEEWIMEYVKNGGKLYSIDNISIIRDGGTIMLIRLRSNLNPIYINKDEHTIHSGYPTTHENLITDKAEQAYILDRLEKHKKDCEHNLKQVNRIIEKIKIMKNIPKEEIIKKWKESGLLDGLTEMDKECPMLKVIETIKEQKVYVPPIVRRILNNLPKDQDIV